MNLQPLYDVKIRLEQAAIAGTGLPGEDFDPAGKKDMARRVEVIAALEGTTATPWLREILPQAKKDVRTAIWRKSTKSWTRRAARFSLG